MKRIMLLLVAGSALLLIVGCSGDSAGESSDGGTVERAAKGGKSSVASPIIQEDGSVFYGSEAMDAAVNIGDDVQLPLWWKDEMLSKELMEAAAMDEFAGTLIPQREVGDNPKNGLDIKLTSEQYAELARGNYTAALSMGWLGDDWATEQIGGIKAELERMGIRVIAVTNADWSDAKQMSDLESIAAMKPDLLFSIPLNAETTDGAYRKVYNTGAKIVFIDQLAKSFTLGEDAVGTVAADCYELGMHLADLLMNATGQKGPVGLMYFENDFWVTNLRTYGFVARMITKYPNVEICVARGHDNPDKGQEVAAPMLARHPDMTGMYASWSIPAMGAEAAATVAGRTPENFAIVCENFDHIVAANMARNGMIKGICSQRPRDQAIAEARLGGLALLGESPHPGNLIPTVPARRENLAEAYQTVYHKPLPAEIKSLLLGGRGSND